MICRAKTYAELDLHRGPPLSVVTAEILLAMPQRWTISLTGHAQAAVLTYKPDGGTFEALNSGLTASGGYSGIWDEERRRNNV